MSRPFLLHNVSLAQELIGIVPLIFQVQPLNSPLVHWIVKVSLALQVIAPIV